MDDRLKQQDMSKELLVTEMYYRDGFNRWTVEDNDDKVVGYVVVKVTILTFLDSNAMES